MINTKNEVTVYISRKAKDFLQELGQPWRYVIDGSIACLINRDDAPTLISLLKEAGFEARY